MAREDNHNPKECCVQLLRFFESSILLPFIAAISFPLLRILFGCSVSSVSVYCIEPFPAIFIAFAMNSFLLFTFCRSFCSETLMILFIFGVHDHFKTLICSKRWMYLWIFRYLLKFNWKKAKRRAEITKAWSTITSEFRAFGCKSAHWLELFLYEFCKSRHFSPMTQKFICVTDSAEAM